MEQIKKEKSDFIKTKIRELREKIARPCTEFETKKFQYDDENKMSWVEYFYVRKMKLKKDQKIIKEKLCIHWYNFICLIFLIYQKH